MYMGNKIITILFLVILVGCNKHVECNLEDINKIYFEGYDKLKITKISFKDLKNQANDFEYPMPKKQNSMPILFQKTVHMKIW
jgi:hypothetical protein